ncbi:hypothetical protein [Desulfococcus multivorans]|jgi:hypothetical protein|uniref:hypothetical protein n=1 Tax=Desulfococcus multivorans TaxID=897 RepID=UPI0011815256|nr:hypothetical protein [Desulfococcus multivorans]MDX9819267.1 hypothetical protein [Desulfococcus multivorans]
MLQLKIYFPHIPKPISGITDQCRLPLTTGCILMTPTLPTFDRSSVSPSPLQNKESRHQPALFDDLGSGRHPSEQDAIPRR